MGCGGVGFPALSVLGAGSCGTLVEAEVGAEARVAAGGFEPENCKKTRKAIKAGQVIIMGFLRW